MTVATTTVADIAGRVVRDYLGIAPGERFAIVVDDRTDVEIPAELARAALAAGGDPIVVTIAPRARSGAEPPAPAAAAMAAADVVLCAASTSLYHTAAKAAAQRAGRSRRVQRPVPGRRLADRRDDRRLRRDPAPRRGAGGPVAPDPRGPHHLPGRHGSASDGDGARADGVADRDLPQPGRGVGAARRRGLAAPGRGNRRGDRRVGAGRVRSRRARGARHDHDPGRSRGRDRGRAIRRPAPRDRRFGRRRGQHRRDRDRAQPRGTHRRRDHRGQEGVRHGPCRARRFGQRVRRAGRMRRPSRRPGHVADDRVRRRRRSSSTDGTSTSCRRDRDRRAGHGTAGARCRRAAGPVGQAALPRSAGGPDHRADARGRGRRAADRRGRSAARRRDARSARR